LDEGKAVVKMLEGKTLRKGRVIKALPYSLMHEWFAYQKSLSGPKSLKRSQPSAERRSHWKETLRN